MLTPNATTNDHCQRENENGPKVFEIENHGCLTATAQAIAASCKFPPTALKICRKHRAKSPTLQMFLSEVQAIATGVLTLWPAIALHSSLLLRPRRSTRPQRTTAR